MDLSLGFLFCSIDLYICLCANTILSWWLSHEYSCLGNPMDSGAWQAAVHGVTKSETWLSTCASNIHLQNTWTSSTLIDRNFISLLLLFELFYSQLKIVLIYCMLERFLFITLISCTQTHMYTIYIHILKSCIAIFHLLHLLSKYLSNVYYVPDIVLINRTDKNPHPHITYFMMRETFDMQDK